MRGLVSPAIEHYGEALRLCHHYENEDTPADIYHGLSMAHTKAGDYVKAYEEAQKALTLYKQKDNIQMECRMLNILGYVCQLLSDFKEASDHYTESLALAYIYNGPTMVMMNCSALAYLRMAEGRLEEARRYCDMALTAAKRSTIPHLPGSVYHVVAKVVYKEAEQATGEQRSKLIEEATQWFEKAIALLKETQANTELAEVCGDYANMLEDLGCTQKALECWHVGYESLSRSRGALAPNL
jgi:tetratricopeptide (TPR) repeat protein